MKQYTLADARKVARLRNGKCLSATYQNCRTKMLWECERGHQWEAVFSRMNTGKTWCAICANLKKLGRPKPVLTLADAQLLATSKNGKCLSTSYQNCRTKMLWECEYKHQWTISLHMLRNGKTWCPECAGKIQFTLQQVQEFATSKNGKCLSKEYCNIMTNMLWECEHNHQWKASFDNIKRGHWCSKCYSIRRTKNK